MKSRLLLDVVIRQGSAIFKLLSSENQSLLVWRNALLVLDFGFDIFDGIGSFNFQSDGLPGKSFDENLHSTSETKDQMKGGFLLDVVIRQGSAIFKLLSSKDQSLLIWRNALLVLDLSFDIFDGIGSFNFQSDCLPGKSFDKNLHSTSETKDQMQGGFLLNVVI